MNCEDLTIIMPTYNTYSGGLYITLNSILNQTYKEFELLIIDDFSTDGTFEQIESYLHEKNIKYTLLRNESNKGVSFSRNVGLSLCRTPYVFLWIQMMFYILRQLKF